jgi:hypothetical protein
MQDQTNPRSSGTLAAPNYEPPEGYLVELNIEELVLQGFAASNREHITESVRFELTRLLVQQGLPSVNREVAYTEAAHEISPDGSAEAAGAQIAQAIYGALKR